MEEDVRDWKWVAALKKGRVGMPCVRPSQAIVCESQRESCGGCGGFPWGGLNAQPWRRAGLEGSRNSTPDSPVFYYIKRVPDSIQLAFRKREL